jgi:dipeptidyl aminopeptidase/acylaminoacyl peptidase
MKLACLLLLVALAAAALPGPAEAAKRPMTVDDLFKFKRVADPQISPDGRLVVYAVTTVTDAAGNKTSSNLWLADADGKSPPRQLTTTDKKDRHPRWSPDGRRILFESNRSGDGQLWVIDLAGGEAQQVTHVSTEASSGIWSPDGSHVAFVSAVYPEFSTKPFPESDEANKKKMEEIKKGPVKARVHTRLFYRHWDSYVEDKRQHLFVQQVAYRKIDSPQSPFGLPKWQPRDVTPGDRDAYPTSTTFETGDNYTFSPDGSHLVFTAVPARDEAWSTNYDLCRVPVNGSTTEWETLTKDNPAADSGPVFSPDGKKLAYRAQKKVGYEADRWELMVVDCDPTGAFVGKPRGLAGSTAQRLDISADEFAWGSVWTGGALRNDCLVFVADHKGRKPVFALAPDGELFMPPLGEEGQCGNLSFSRDGRACAFTVARMDRPAEVFVDHLGGPTKTPARNLSHANDQLLAELDLPRPESVTVAGAGGTPMQMWVLKPPGFDPAKKWPLAYLVHGGPQGAWEDGWSYRWNPELWAAQGYVVALPNPRGSTGFGQKYVDEISGDWGGRCFEDLMKGADYLEKLPYIDKDRMAAAGASFGGYMMNWFAVNTGRFQTLITHCGVYNFESMYTTTEEVWFDEWEHGGPPWGKNRESYEKYSPHRLAANLGKFRTPMLIIQNDLDYRVPVSEGQQLFTALQRQGVPSKFINFPDEGHWVLKPANSKFWHEQVFAWLTRHVPPGPRDP